MNDHISREQITASTLSQLAQFNLRQRVNQLSTEEQVTLLKMLMTCVEQSWSNLLEDFSPGSPVASFYDDEMLGFNVCQQINGLFFEIYIDSQESQEYSTDNIWSDYIDLQENCYELFDSLCNYMDLMHSFSLPGDISKRGCEAAASMALAFPSLCEKLRMHPRDPDLSNEDQNWREYALHLADSHRMK